MATRVRLIALGALAALLAAGFWWWRAEAVAPDGRGPLVVTGVVSDEEHRVTPEMEQGSAAMIDRPAPGFVAIAHDRREVDSAGLIGDRPIVLVFIKDGCPCSTSAEPFFARLHARYGDRAAFLGIIDGDPEVAARWVSAHGTPYPVLADAGLEIIRSYGITNSATVALIDREGRIVSHWPGYSEGMLRDMSAQLSSLTGLPDSDVGAAEAPELPYTGCPFPIDEAE